jgi:hypothetical protein
VWSPSTNKKSITPNYHTPPPLSRTFSVFLRITVSTSARHPVLSFMPLSVCPSARIGLSLLWIGFPCLESPFLRPIFFYPFFLARKVVFYLDERTMMLRLDVHGVSVYGNVSEPQRIHGGHRRLGGNLAARGRLEWWHHCVRGPTVRCWWRITSHWRSIVIGTLVLSPLTPITDGGLNANLTVSPQQ